MITAKYILENEAGERFDLTAPANIFLVNVEGLGITTNVTYGDLENGFFHTLYEQTPQNNITGDLVYQNAAYDNYQALVNWIIRAKTLYFCYQPLETEYRRIVKLNYIAKERRTAGGWMRAGISFAPLTPWYLAQPTEIGMGGIEEELSKGYFLEEEASYTIEPVQAGSGEASPSNVRPITPGLTLVRDDESTLEVYGGTLDAATRTLTATYGALDLGTISWSHSTNYPNLYYGYATGKKAGLGNFLASSYAVHAVGYQNLADFETGGAISSTGINVMDSRYASSDAATFKAAVTGQTIVFELATPVTYQLTDAEVNRALDALDGFYGYRYTNDLRYGGDAAGTMSATIAPSGHVPAAVVLRYTGAITNPRVRLVGAETGIVYGICEINTSLTSGQTFELSTRYEDSHVMLIDGGTETSLLGYVNQAYETYFRCPTTESAVLTIESDNAFSGEATLLVYTYFGSV